MTKKSSHHTPTTSSATNLPAPVRDPYLPPEQASCACTPGVLLSNLPGALGFFPRESVIFMGFTKDAEKLILGPTARVDIPALAEQAPAAFAAVAEASEVIFAFVISARPPLELDEIADYLFNYSSADNTGIDACWYTPEIANGQPYEVWFGPDTPMFSGTTDWREGTIPAVARSATMTHLIEHGRLPEVSRDDAIRQMSLHNTQISERERATLAAHAQVAADSLVMRASRSGHGICPLTRNKDRFDTDALLNDVHGAVNALLDQIDPGADPAELYTQREILQAAATWLSATTLRDIVVEPLLLRPAPTAVLMLALMHTFRGRIRSNALVIYAGTQLAVGLSMYAGLALGLAVHEDPEHTLAKLVHQGYRAGIHSRMLDNLFKGSQAAQQHWGGGEAAAA